MDNLHNYWNLQYYVSALQSKPAQMIQNHSLQNPGIVDFVIGVSASTSISVTGSAAPIQNNYECFYRQQRDKRIVSSGNGR